MNNMWNDDFDPLADLEEMALILSELTAAHNSHVEYVEVLAKKVVKLGKRVALIDARMDEIKRNQKSNDA